MSSSLAPHLFQEEVYSYNSRVLIIIPRPWHKILDDEKALMAKILSSVRINIESVTIQDQPKVVLGSLSVFKPEKVLIFGSDVTPEIPLYEKATVEGITVIRADDLSRLDENRKKSLWVALKQMFSA